MAKNNSDVSLWEQRKEPPSSKKGLYYQQRVQLIDLLAEAKRLSMLTIVDQRHYALHCEAFTTQGYTTITSDLEVNFLTGDLKIAIFAEGATHYYNLTDNGTAVNVDDFTTDDEEWPYLREGIEVTIRELKKAIKRKNRVRAERRQKKRKRLIALFCVFAIGTLGFFCARWMVFEPKEEANRARIAYDAANHQIEGEGYKVDAHALESLPDGALNSIPGYGGDDRRLTHPRIISLSANSNFEWCSSIRVEIPSNSALVVATEEDSLFVRDHYVATYVDDELTVCLVDGFSKTEASERFETTLALQVKPLSETN